MTIRCINTLVQVSLISASAASVQPFICARTSDFPLVSYRRFWLEYYLGNNAPNFNTPADWHPYQTVEDYRRLPQRILELPDGCKLLTYDAVCERIKDGVIGVVRLKYGWLWTMLPDDCRTIGDSYKENTTFLEDLIWRQTEVQPTKVIEPANKKRVFDFS